MVILVLPRQFICRGTSTILPIMPRQPSAFASANRFQKFLCCIQPFFYLQ